MSQSRPSATYIYNGKDRVPKDATSIIFDQSVVEIADYAFKDCTSLTAISIPEPIVQIGNYAFYDCHNLRSILLPPSMKEIGNAAFDGCISLTSITIPPSITKIRYRTFYRCTNLLSVFLPELTIRDIRNNAFSECQSLTLICIPSSVKTVLYSAFDNCDALKLALSNNNQYCVNGGGSSDDDERTSSSTISYRHDTHEVQGGDDLESWLLGRFNHLPLHKLCYYYGQSFSFTDCERNSVAVEDSDNENDNNDGHRDDNSICEENGNNNNSNSKRNTESPTTKDQIKAIMQNTPEAIRSIDALGMTPLHVLACRCCYFLTIATTANTSSLASLQPMHLKELKKNIKFKTCIEILEIMNEMLNLDPDLATVKNHKGMTPLDLYIKCCYHSFESTCDTKTKSDSTDNYFIYKPE